LTEEIRIAVGLPPNATDDHLRFARQLGCEGVVLATPARLGDKVRWEYDDLVALRKWVEGFGLRVEALQNVPHSFWMKTRLGLPGRDEELENLQATIRNIGRAGIPILSYNFRPDQLYRTGTKPGRGGAEVTAFDLAAARDRPLTFGRVISTDEMWSAYEYAIKALLPAAESVGIRLALHPDDPPGPSLGGVARIFSSFEGFERAAWLADSPAWALLYCVGCWAEMGGVENVLRGIRHFGSRGQIAYVHFRDVQGTIEQFDECFLGEGDLDVTGVLKALREVGFAGCVIDDHAPRMLGDEGWNFRSRAYQTGYLMGLLWTRFHPVLGRNGGCWQWG
jgi:mannonate dehydratase